MTNLSVSTKDQLTLLSLLSQFDTLNDMADVGRVTVQQHEALGKMIIRDISKVVDRYPGRRHDLGPVMEATLLTQEIRNQ